MKKEYSLHISASVRAFALAFAGLIALSAMPAPAKADTLKGGEDWSVTFTTDKKMESTFKTADLDDVIDLLQPGDEALMSLDLSNKNGASTDWYMTNKVLYSLEDRSRNKETAGGAYTYRLTYTNPKKEVTVLFDSDMVGGETVSKAGEGLHEATDGMEEYFFLDELSTGQTGTIDLKVALDGETQGNDYQDTLADLEMQFAVEMKPVASVTPAPSPSGTPAPTTTPSPNTPNNPPGTNTHIYTPGSPNVYTTTVRTGDDTNMIPYFIMGGISGLVLLILAVATISMRKRSRRKGGKS